MSNLSFRIYKKHGLLTGKITISTLKTINRHGTNYIQSKLRYRAKGRRSIS